MNKLFMLATILCMMLVSFSKEPKLSSFTIERLGLIKLDTINIVSNHYTVKEHLTRLVYTEAALEPMEGKIAVINVIYNRARLRNLSIKQVIDRKGQFDGRWGSTFYTEKYKKCLECFEAVRMAEEGYEVVPHGVIYFYNPKTSTDSRFISSIEGYIYADIGRHRFCYKPDLLIKKL